MHQTFYIDIDEEITSIVDRLRKIREEDVVIVVPKRALLIQSIVNLKLLKKEAEKLGKNITIVTQDKLGKLIVEKAGINLENKLDDIAGEEISQPDVAEERENISNLEIEREDISDLKSRIENIGSESYSDESDLKSRIPIKAKKTSFERLKVKREGSGDENIINKELVLESQKEKKRNTDSVGKAIAKKNIGNIDIREKKDYHPEKSVFNKSFLETERESSEAENDTKLKKFFKDKKKFSYDDFDKKDLPGKFKKYIVIFLAIIFLTGLFFSAYLFLPKATVKISVKSKSQSIDSEIKGDASATAVDYEKKIIPIKEISADDQVSGTFDATGGKTVSNQKARGTITIYNEFSASPQPLVATTRFLSSDNKVFRLTKSIVVPGTSKVGSETKPGAIEAEVIADNAGSEYNIGPGKFTIPGFQNSGTEKFSKIYAQSSKAMTGGGNKGDDVKAVSASDIESAKNKLNSNLTQSVKTKIKNLAGSGEVVLDDAINIVNPSYTLSNTEGETVDKFTVTVKTSVTALVFSEKDVKDIINREVSKDLQASIDSANNQISLDYGKADVDFSLKTMKIRLNAIVKAGSNIDLENLKKGILGKKESDLEAYLKTYPNITNAEINYWPPFMGGKIPLFQSRVDIILDNK